MQGIHNMIYSDDREDILNTIKMLNQSYIYSTDNFYKLIHRELHVDDQ